MSNNTEGQALQIAARISELMDNPNHSRSKMSRDACAQEQEKLSNLWASRYGVTLAKTPDWWGRLIKNVPSHHAGRLGLPPTLPSDDHVSLWTKEGKPHLWVSQPYDLRIAEMMVKAELLSLKFKIDTFPSWYYPARTHLVVWSKQVSRSPR